MRPRSRQLVKTALQLPTIREGYEDMVRDMNQTNSLLSAQQQPHGPPRSLSSEDYLLSIGHLARPTFPVSEVISPRPPDSPHLGMRLPRFPAMTSDLGEDAEWRSPGTAPRLRCDVIGKRRGERRGVDSDVGPGGHGLFDPLEYLYGHQNNLTPGDRQSSNVRLGLDEGMVARGHREGLEGCSRPRAHSVPRPSPPALPRQRKSSCPDIGAPRGRDASPAASPLRTPPPDRRVRPSQKETSPVQASLLSQWISDCRSAWREARVHACMLPAIAEI